MPTFGQHQTGQRLHLSGVGALYVLAADGKRVLKVLQPPAGIWTDEQMQAEIEAFLSRGKTQQTLARASANWAPIHEVAAIREGTEGSSGGGEAASMAGGADYRASGAFAVMDRYERTIGSLIDGHVNLNNDDLRNLMSGIIRGLGDIRKVGGRPHGNLKASNILLADSGDLAKATVHLSDPAVASAVNPNSEKKDFSDLARILYELVNLRLYQGGTVPRTKDWNELGPNGEDWRKLCNTLLDGGAPEDRDLDKLLATVDTWRARPRKHKVSLAVAAIALVLIVAGVGAFWYFSQPPKLDFNQKNWEELCLDYRAWFEDFAGMDDATRKKYAAAPYPTEVVKLLDGAAKYLDRYQPQNIAKARQGYDALAAAPTDEAKTGSGPYYTQQGVELIEHIGAALTPAQWPLLTSLEKTAADYEQRGWRRPAAGIRALIESARPPAVPAGPADIQERAKLMPKVDMFANIDNTIKAANSVLEIDKRWASIEEQIKSLPATEVPLLKALPKFAEDLPRSEPAEGNAGQGTLADVQALAASFSQIERVVGELGRDLKNKDQPIDFAELARDPAAQVPADGKLTVDRYAALPAVAREYVRLKEDPRGSVAWTAALDEVQGEMIDKIKEANPGDEHLKELLERKAALQQQVGVFAGISPIEKNRSQLNMLVAAARKDLTKLKEDGGLWVAPYIIDPQKYIAQQQDGLINGALAKADARTNPVVLAQWRKAHQALLAKIEAAPQDLKKFRTFKAVDAKFAALQSIYADFNGKMVPPREAGLSSFAGGDWKSIIASRVARVYRDQGLTDLMTNPALKWNDDLPQVNEAAYQSYARERTAAFDRLCLDAKALIEDFSTIDGRLDHLDLLANEPVKDAPTWRDLAAKWKDAKSPLLADGEIAGALRPISDRVAALLALDSVKDYKALAAGALSAAPEIALGAWRKLAAVPVPENLPVLEDEDRAETHVAALLAERAKAGVLDARKVSAIGAEIKAQRPVRWQRYADTLSSAAAIQSALDRRADFAVSLSASNTPALFYDDLLYQLRRQFEKNPPEAQLKDGGRRFIDAVRAMPPAVSRDAGVQDLLARMEKSLAQNAEESSAAGAGPRLAGWEQVNAGPEVRDFYFPSRAAAKEVLEFSRVQAGQKTVYLCTTEVSFGVFAQVVNSSDRFADLDNTGKPEAQAHWFKVADDPWDGPRVWKIVDRKFVPNDDWAFKSAQMGDSPVYPNAPPEKPGGLYPMQQLSPWSAMYVARLLGCRLPTSEEWKAAYDKFEAAGPRDAWNLRGSGWMAQQDYAKKMATKGAQYPDQGIFLQPDQLFAGITAELAKPWQSGELAKLAPNRITGGGGVYPTSQIWFRKVGEQPGVAAPGQGKGGFHDLVGNVAEYVFDAPGANAVTKDTKVSVDSVNAAIAAGARDLFVIGGSSLSPPETSFLQKQPVAPDFAQTSTGFSDVGFRLAYTAPVDSIADVLASAFRSPPYLSGSAERNP